MNFKMIFEIKGKEKKEVYLKEEKEEKRSVIEGFDQLNVVYNFAVIEGGHNSQQITPHKMVETFEEAIKVYDELKKGLSDAEILIDVVVSKGQVDQTSYVAEFLKI